MCAQPCEVTQPSRPAKIDGGPYKLEHGVRVHRGSTIGSACTQPWATEPRPRLAPAWRRSPCARQPDILISPLHTKGGRPSPGVLGFSLLLPSAVRKQTSADWPIRSSVAKERAG